ncbi:MAG: glycosyltransferase family 4 protein [Chloroflexota bacterium]|mgnify:CR=1 FL=1
MSSAPLRVLGLTMEHVSDFRSRPNTKSAGLYMALDRRFTVVDVVRPAPSKLELYLAKLRHFHPNRDVWRARAGLSLALFRRRTAIAERRLRQLDGRYDLIVQLHTLFAPGRLDAGRPYVLHTDNTYMLSERYFPQWAPLRGRARDAWVALEGATYRQAAFLFPRSEFLRRSMIEDYGCDPARVIRVGGGANFDPPPLDGKRYDRQIALFVGSDFARKGGMTLLRAWGQVRRELPRAELWIVGPKRPVGPPQPGVRWHGFVTDRAALERLYAQATLFVMPSLFEPWGHVFFEAMAYGLPCIGSDQGATPEIIRDGVTGRLVPPGQPGPLAEALVALLADPREAEELGRRAHAEVARGHRWDDVVARMAPYLELAVSGTRAVAA